MTAAVITYVMPKKYESEATIEVKPRRPGMSPLGDRLHGDFGRQHDPQFFGTEFEKIKSRNSLEKVVENLELGQSLERGQGNRAADPQGDRQYPEHPRNRPDFDPGPAHQQGGCEGYLPRKSRMPTRNTGRKSKVAMPSGSLHELNKAVRDQEDKVEERRKVLATIVRTKGIIYKGSDSFYGSVRSGRGSGSEKRACRPSISSSRRRCSWRARSAVCSNTTATN